MKEKSRSKQSGSVKSHSWRVPVGVAAALLLLGSAVSAVSMRGEPSTFKALVAGRSADVSDNTPAANKGASRHYVTTDAAGQKVVVDRQTGQVRPLTQEEAQTLAEGIRQLVNQSTDGLVQVRRANGAVSMDLQGHFQNVLLAKQESDGTVSQSCVNDLESAADFFEIDPALLGVAAPVSKSQPASTKWPDR